MALRSYSGRRYRGWVHPDLETFPLLLEYPEKLEGHPEAEVLLLNESRAIFRVRLRLGARSESFFAYYFRNGSLSRALRRCYAFRSLHVSRLLRRNGFRTLDIVVALKRRGEWLNWHSLLVAREIGPVVEVPSGGSHVFRIHPSAELDESLVTAVALELARLHGRGFFHGDLKTRHLLVRRSGTTGPEIFFVDLEKCHHFPSAPSFLRDLLTARDLIQFFASLEDAGASSDRLRRLFFDRYLTATGLSERRSRRLLRLLDQYGSEGVFRQGEPLIQGLSRWLKRKRKSKSGLSNPARRRLSQADDGTAESEGPDSRPIDVATGPEAADR